MLSFRLIADAHAIPNCVLFDYSRTCFAKLQSGFHGVYCFNDHCATITNADVCPCQMKHNLSIAQKNSFGFVFTIVDVNRTGDRFLWTRNMG